jgi:hypothetical protein
LHPDCTFSSAGAEGALRITVATHCRNVHQRLGLCMKIPLHRGAEHTFEVHEFSALAWPRRYRVRARGGYY